MATRKTLNFLPSIFRTDTNRKFLGATLDHLVSEPQLISMNGFVGRKFSTTYKPDDRFITEDINERQNYQFEPSVVIKNNNKIETFCDYPDLINKLNYYGGNTTNHNRLFESEYYTYDPHIDFNKFVNYTEYYWLPSGPDTVTVSSGYDVDSKTYTFTRTISGYTTNLTGNIVNPEITLIRGVQYSFVVNQTGHKFYIQTEPGTSGKKQYNQLVSSSNIQGLSGVNGTESGTISLNLPEKNLQDYYFELPVIDYVDYATTQAFSQLDGSSWQIGSNAVTQIDQDTDYPNDRYIVFLGDKTNNTLWTDYTGNTVPLNRRTGLWKLRINAQNAIRLEYVRDIPISTRLKINNGASNRGYEFFKDTNSNIVLSPQITAPLDVLYYQDKDNSAFYGRIKIVDAISGIINVDDDIIGNQYYISPRGISFTNGLKITFDDTVFPQSYRGKTYIVEGVGDSIKLVDYAKLVIVEDKDATKIPIPFDKGGFDATNFDSTEDVAVATAPDYIVMNRSSTDVNAWTRANRWFHQDLIKYTAEINKTDVNFDKLIRAQRPIIEFKSNLQLYNSGRVLLSIIDRCDQVIKSDSTSITDAFLQINDKYVNSQSLITMNYREGQKTIFPNDVDPVVRSTVYTVSYKDRSASAIFDSTGTGNIIYNINSTSVRGVGGNTNFTSQIIVGSSLYSSSGVYVGKVKTVSSSSRLELESAPNHSSSGTGFKINYPIIELISYAIATEYDTVVVRAESNAKKTYWFNGSDWILAQLKTEKNQAILFDVIDADGNSFSSNLYPLSRFSGNKIFSYKTGSSVVDPVLGLNLSYNAVGNSIADINFYNDFESESFTYSNTKTLNVSSGYLRLNTDRYNFTKNGVWSNVAEESKQFQHFVAVFDEITNYFEIDIQPGIELKEKHIKVFVNNTIIDNSKFEVVNVGIVSAVKINQTLPEKAKIDILIYNKESVSSMAYYEIPSNFEFNPLNQKFDTISLGQIRTHYQKILENVNQINSREQDLDISGISGTILQHSAPVHFASAFLVDREINFIDSIDYARRDYTKFKNKFVELATNLEINTDDIAGSVDLIISKINEVKNSESPWFYSDMIPHGDEYFVDRYKIVNTAIKTYTLATIYNAFDNNVYQKNKPSDRAILVYLNNTLLIIGRDYDLSDTSPLITLSNSLVLNQNDILTINGYTSTDGSCVPETPTKLGLYPKFLPTKYLDDTYRTPINVIQGHDGSIIPAYDDYRDDLILELENRIYNNIKTSYTADVFDITSYIPGRFRSTEYNLNEFNRILTVDFLKWTGVNQVDFSKNTSFQPGDAFTWNYNQTSDLVDGQALSGYWRNIYKYFYDTDRPHTHPWEILGYSQKPTWWNTYYGAAPYTSTNTMLWNDLAAGYSRGTNTTNVLYARGMLQKFIPVNQTGELLPPVSVMTGTFNGSKFSQSFSIGDGGPVESAWRRSSEYPFTVHRTLALMKPARYFSLLSDAINIDKINGQYVNILTNSRINIKDVVLNGENVNGTITRTASYINWVNGYITSIGLNAINTLRTKLSDLSINLSYKMSGFTDKKYLTALVDQYSPQSTNQTVVVPDENYKIHLNKSVTKRRAVYSAVIVEKTTTGYAISGYDLENPYFTVIPSEFNGKFYNLQVLNANVLIFEDFVNELVTVPYGFELANSQEVVDFLVGYQRYLQYQGFVFEDYQYELNQLKDWILSAKEFLTWTLQDWKEGSLIVLSPVSDSLVILNDNYVVDEITNKLNSTQILNQSFKVIPFTDLSFIRDDDTTAIKTFSGQTITYADLNLVQYEHVLVFDNTTVFQDVIFKPELGTRQYRIKLVGNKTGEWNGSIYAPGFIYANGVIDNWQSGRDYFKGDLVTYKNQTYVALANIVATDTFEFDEWALSDSNIVDGLLPNFSKNAVASKDFYNVDSLTIDENFDLFSNSLIGYRNRTHLENLGLDRTSQSKFYQGYIRDKGTKNAVSALYNGVFDNIKNEFSMYEEWGVRTGEYGDINSKQKIELILDDNKFKGSPIAIKIAAQPDDNDNLILVKRKDLYSYPQNYDGSIFLNRQFNDARETDILTAGYVNIIDVDAQIFDLSQYTSISADTLSALRTGYKLWIAKDLGDQWQVYNTYKADNAVAVLEYGLDNKLKFTFAYDHGLQVGSIFAIKDFNPDFDGFYQVLNTEESNTVVATFNVALAGLLAEPIIGAGELYVFESLRYTTIAERDSRISKIPHSANDLVWVDNNDTGIWETYRLNSDTITNFSGINHVWEIDAGSVHLRATGLPYHSYGSANIAAPEAQNYNRTWPLRAGTAVAAEVSSSREIGIIGFWLNGVAITSPDFGDFIPTGYAPIADLNYNLGYANYSNVSIDNATGLITEDLRYVYSGNPLPVWLSGRGNISDSTGSTLHAEINAIQYYNGSLNHADGHSKIVGFAADGYPIYGPFGYIQATDKFSGISRLASGYTLKSSSYRAITDATDLNLYPMGIFVQDYEFTGAGDLDVHNGRYCVTPDYPNGTYAYFTPVDANSKAVYPYVIGNTFYGELPVVVNSSENGNGAAPLYYSTNLNWTSTGTQQSVVELASIDELKLYDSRTKTIITYLDHIDPVKGKILGVAQDDIDFVTAFDPAKYSTGTNTTVFVDSNYHWGKLQVGKIWWDISTIRYYDYEQFDLDYRLENWGKLFPGSTVNVYEWISSNVLPSAYVASGGDGIPKFIDDSAYVSELYVDGVTGVIKTRYFYWVSGKSTAESTTKRYSSLNLAEIIQNPRDQSIPYAAVLRDDTIALYNIDQYVSRSGIVASIGYKTRLVQNNIYSEYELFQEDNPSSVLNSRIEDKLIDSLVGFDVNNNFVPDPTLSAGSKIGLDRTPSQTLINDRLGALQNVLTYVNGVLIRYPVASRLVNKEMVYSDNFYAVDPLPAESEYDFAVNDLQEFNYISEINAANIVQGKQYVITSVGNTNFIAAGASANAVGITFVANSTPSGTGKVHPSRVLIKTNADYNNSWTVNKKNADGSIGDLVKLQTFDVSKFWYFVDWYSTNYNSKTKSNYVVATYVDTYKLDLVVDDVVKVLNDGNNFELYRYSESNKLELIGLGNGTIQLSSVLWDQLGYDIPAYDSGQLDFDCAIELRYIFRGIKEDLLVNDLAVFYNKFIFNIVRYILSEQKYLDWIFKTSFVSIVHGVEMLTQEKKYIKDRQLYYEQYVNEVKPYRTKLREYVLSYINRENLNSMVVTDFDLPSYYDSDLDLFRSPNGSLPGKDTELLATKAEYQDWKNNYKYTVSSVDIASPGLGHRDIPALSVVSKDPYTSNANVVATINSNGSIISTEVLASDTDFVETPIVVVSGSGTTEYSNVKPSVLIANITNNKIRKLRTVIKFDRVQYNTQVVNWQSGVAYAANTYVSYGGVGYISSNVVPASQTFDFSKFTVVDSGMFNNANDRITAFYSPTANMIPKDLTRLMTGLNNSQVEANVSYELDAIVAGGGFTGVSLPVTQLVAGERYIITSTRETDFTQIGAADNRVGLVFTATGSGTGEGRVVLAIDQNALGNVGGIAAEDITLSGGAFVDELFSHAPEELLPGIVYDTVSIAVINDNLSGAIGYRRFTDMNGNRKTTEINENNMTTLAAPLLLTDTTISVTNGSALPIPGALNVQPGVLHINGERIEYYTKNGNILGQIRRGVGGTAIATMHEVNSVVESVSTVLSILTQ